MKKEITYQSLDKIEQEIITILKQLDEQSKRNILQYVQEKKLLMQLLQKTLINNRGKRS